MDRPLLRRSTPKIEGVLQVSKWIKCAVLLDIEEMQDLLQVLGQIDFFIVSEPVQIGKERISSEMFLNGYSRYVEGLKRGEIPDPNVYRTLFSCSLSKTPAIFYAMDLSDGRALVKSIQPVIQLQAHYFFYSAVDGKFHSMVQGSDSISWGVQFSYPQLFQDPHTRKIAKVVGCENTSVFSTLMQWMRSHTLPTPFIVNKERTNSPIRTGKQALSWVHNHLQLKQKGITIYANRDRVDWE